MGLADVAEVLLGRVLRPFDMPPEEYELAVGSVTEIAASADDLAARLAAGEDLHAIATSWEQPEKVANWLATLDRVDDARVLLGGYGRVRLRLLGSSTLLLGSMITYYGFFTAPPSARPDLFERCERWSALAGARHRRPSRSARKRLAELRQDELDRAQRLPADQLDAYLRSLNKVTGDAELEMRVAARSHAEGLRDLANRVGRDLTRSRRFRPDR